MPIKSRSFGRVHASCFCAEYAYSSVLFCARKVHKKNARKKARHTLKKLRKFLAQESQAWNVLSQMRHTLFQTYYNASPTEYSAVRSLNKKAQLTQREARDSLGI